MKISNKKSTVVLIPLRGGSKAIPQKNIKYFAGKPLFLWVTEAAINTPNIDEVFISTESEEIKRVVLKYNLNVKIINRPQELAQDNSSTEDVLIHFSEKESFDTVITIQATSPLLSSMDLESALALFRKSNYDSMLSVVPNKRFYWTENGSPINYDPTARPRRQEFEGNYLENGAFYITKREILKKHRNRLGGNIGLFKMPEETGVEIDDENDWIMTEAIMNHKLSKMVSNRLPKIIELIVFDFDGVFTNNAVYVDQNGTETVKCNRSDGLGIGLLKKTGINFFVLSTEKNPVVVKRCEKMGIDCVNGIDNKKEYLENFCESNKIDLKNVVYVGNDINDLECMEKVGCGIAVSDAYHIIKETAQFVLQNKGGEGAVRELIDIILKKSDRK